MRISFRGFLSAFVLVILLVVLGSLTVMGFSGEEKKGIVTYTDGQVKRRSPEVETWQDATVNTAVLSGDKVRTYRKSRAEVDLAQLDLIRLAPRTIIDIVKLYEETKEKNIQTEINIEQGEIWASVHEVETKTQFDVSSPIAAAAITGTLFRLNVGEDSTTQLKVYTGEVNITNAPHKKDLKPKSLIPREVPGPVEIPGPREVSVEEWLYIVKSMQQITIDRHGKVVSKGKFNQEDEDEKSDWVAWNKKRDEERLKRLKESKNR